MPEPIHRRIVHARGYVGIVGRMTVNRAYMMVAIFLASVATYGCGDGSGGTGGAGGGGGSGGAGGAPPVGACCTVDQACRDSSLDECSARGGAFTEAELCAGLTCAAPEVDDLRQAAERLEILTRDEVETYIDAVSTIGREYWNLNGDDPRYTNELLGRQGAPLEADGPFNTRTFLARYRVVQHAARLIRAVEAATEAASGLVTAQEANALIGYAKTLQAYALLLLANHQFSNGILPVDALDDPDPSGSFLNYDASLQHIADLLDDGAAALTNGGATFIFSLSLGFQGFSTPAAFRQVNRALAARVRIYMGDKTGSISGIAGSFLNINGSMTTGPAHAYSFEARNPMHHRPDEDLYTVHPSFVSEVDPGDLRFSQKTRPYVPTPDFFVPVSFEGLIGDRQVQVVQTDQSPFPIIRNEELILIYAETQIGSDVNESLAAINRVRNAAGLGNYLGATGNASILTEVLRQRRYSLYGEGHRWVDLRRTGRLGEIPTDRVGDVVHLEFPRPDAETLGLISGL